MRPRWGRGCRGRAAGSGSREHSSRRIVGLGLTKKLPFPQKKGAYITRSLSVGTDRGIVEHTSSHGGEQPRRSVTPVLPRFKAAIFRRL